jgi:hypothetical protein
MTVEHIEKSELRGRVVGGRSTYQRLLTPPFAITPSEILFCTIQQHISQIPELWVEYWGVIREI